MSDAITLDVLSSSPVQLDVGDADPIAREEIAALAGRVTTVEGDVSGLSTRMGAVEGDVTALGTTVDGINERVEAIEADYVTSEDVMDALGGEAPALVSGSSRAVLGDAETASWMERTTAADGAALIDAIYGNTLRWNQLRGKNSGSNTQTKDGIAWTNNSDGSVTVSGTASATGYFQFVTSAMKQGHKYLVKGCCPAGGTSDTYCAKVGASVFDTGSGGIFSKTAADSNVSVSFNYTSGAVVPQTTLWPQLFDLTAMFGTGNEPSTAAEFEALFPEPYYPYDPGSLLPVRMEGIETVGFNQWDEQWEPGAIDHTTGENIINVSTIRSKNYIPVFPSTTYYAKIPNSFAAPHYYDADKSYIGYENTQNTSGLFTTPANAHYMRFNTSIAYGATYNNDICINLSDPSRNGTYEPYWRSERAIPVATYFPDGMRSAGTVCDELRADAAVTRVGERAYQSGDESDARVITDGTVTHYALATPTTTPIDPPLPMSYRTGAGGTERVMVASGTQSAPPVFATRYPLDPADLAASIAPVDGPTATTNHQVGDLIMLGFTLCKATQVIVTGETIEIGTNVTKTTVAAELAALS